MRAIACGLTLITLVTLALAQQPAGRQFALLVGVSNYKGTDLSSLRFTENDAADLAGVLKTAGFRRVVLMTRSEAFDRKDDELFPTAANIRLQIASILQNRQPGDTVVLGFSGHGVEPKGVKGLFFCPERADLGKPETLVSLAEVQDALKNCPAGVKLLIADACRNDPADGRSAVVDKLESVTRPVLPQPPRGVVALFSCSAGQKAFESEKFKRGYLFHAVIEGLKGQAAGRGGDVDLLGLAAYAVNEVPEWVKEDRGASANQVPQLLGDVTGRVVLVKSSGDRGRVSTPSPSAPAGVKAPSPPKKDLDTARAEEEEKKAHGSRPTPSSPDKLDLIDGVTIDLVLIQPGSFTMAAGGSGVVSIGGVTPYDLPAHPVRISQPFYLGKTEVTVGQFRCFVAETGYKTEAETDGQGGQGLSGDAFPRDPAFNWQNPGWPQTEVHPVVNVSWNDATKFCAWLSRKSGRKVVLPSEAQWEYACRAGSTKHFSFGDDPRQLAQHGNVIDESAQRRFPHWATIVPDDGHVFTAPVGRYRPNAWNLFDMHGNVAEWCRDGARKYENRAETDPEGPADGWRVYRGGTCAGDHDFSRAAYRSHKEPSYRSAFVGFRVAVLK